MILAPCEVQTDGKSTLGATEPIGANAVRFAVEPFGTWYEEAQPLFKAHWGEIARHRDRFPLNPDWDRYLALQKSGALFAMTARRGWQLAGYAVFIVGPHLHYMEMKLASQDMVYLMPELRAGGFGYCALLRFAERELKVQGVHFMTQRDKVTHDLSPVYRRLNYAQVERVWEKAL